METREIATRRETNRNHRNKGVTLVYMAFAMAGMVALSTLAVDLGHVQMAKTELRATADSVARAATAGLPDGSGQVRSLANQYAAANTVDMQGLTLQAEDVVIGRWITTAPKPYFRKLNANESYDQANAVHVDARRRADRGTAIPLSFGKLFNIQSCDINAGATAMLIPGVNVNQDISAQANPFLVGMPQGTKASVINPSPRKIPDVAGTAANPLNSPMPVNMPIVTGDSLTFDSINGDARHDPGLLYNNPDGDIDDPNDPIGHNNSSTVYNNNYSMSMNNENGIADAWIPINALVGVFLDDSAPNTSNAPANLDFRTPESRDFSTLKPQLKQLFFIGDGLDSHGVHQNFIVPKGATRLYLATMDYYEWNNNAGYRKVRVNRPSHIVTVE